MEKTNDLPHDLLAEKSLIGCLLIDGSVYDEISDLAIGRQDFFHPRYGMVFDAIRDLANSNNPIDYVTVSSKLSSSSKLEELGGKSFILEIIEEQASAANVYHYAKIVKDKSSLRNIIRSCSKMAQKGHNFEGNIDDFIVEVESSIFKLSNDAKSGRMVKLSDCLNASMKSLEDPSHTPGQISGLPTGYAKLDKMLLGMQAGQFIVIAARPAMGKTALAMNILVNACKKNPLPMVVFSLEMMAEELSKRVLAGEAKISSNRFRIKDFRSEEIKRLGGAVQEISQYPIFINDSGDSTIYDILSQCRKIKAEQGLGLIMIDYLQLMKSHSSNPSREQQISEISRSLKTMAKELECPVIGLSQLNRAAESRPNKRPNTAELRESGAIEQDADIVMLIYRDEVYDPNTKEPGVAEIIVAKNRNGTTGTVKLSWLGEYTCFENL
ncbi:MAG: replicative DNA helicase, partial [Halobacteriovoraceae bacterium]|nr:replicative DNA helicase [Halobacteriovoraceae bacterium]